MNLNPFAKKDKDDLGRELNSNERNVILDSVLKNTQDEQVIIEQQRERAELTRWQQDLSEEIRTMVHRLRSEVQEPESGKWIKLKVNGVEAPPLCSEECIWRLVSMIEPSTSKNLMMSKYEKEYILATLLRLSNTVALDVLLANRRKYNIKMADMGPICDIFRTAADPTYFRALGANEKDYLKGIRKDTHIHTEGQQKKEGFLNL